MENINNLADLRSAIQSLENRETVELLLLKEELLLTLDALKPLHVLKAAISEFTSSPDFKNNFVGTTLGLTVGYISKTLLFGTSFNPVKQLIADYLELGIANIVAKNQDVLKSVANRALDFFTKKKTTTTTTENYEAFPS
jgi:hypothetical protein